MNNIDLESERLIFCRLSDKHISTDYVNWINDSEVNTYLETRGNYTIDQLKLYIEVNILEVIIRTVQSLFKFKF